MITYPSGPDTPHSALPLSPVTRFGDLLFVSGQASVDASGKIVSDTFEGEMRRALENLSRVLADARSDLSLVAQTRNYVRDEKDLARFNEIYREFFSEPFPARTTITNCLPPTLKYEIECIAAVKDGNAAERDATGSRAGSGARTT